MGDTSLERSHSKVSNFKLTLISLLFTVCLNGLIITIALKEKLPEHVWGITCAVFGVLNLLCLMLFSIFKR